MMQIIGTFAEFERAMLHERTKSGLDAARKQGRIGGRRPKLKENQRKEIISLISSGQKPQRRLQDSSMFTQQQYQDYSRMVKPLNPVFRSIAP